MPSARTLAALCVVGWSCCAGATQAQVVTLGELEARALRARPSLRANDARIAQARAHVDAARAAYSPTFAVVGDFSLAPGSQLVRINEEDRGGVLVSGSRSINQSGAFTPLPRAGLMLDARGNIYDFGRTDAAVDSALAQQRAAQAEVHKITHDIVRDVRAAYVRWAMATALWTLADKGAAAARERAKQTDASIEEGARPSADRLAAQSDSVFAELELSRARATLETAREDLSFLCVTDLAANARPAPEVLEKGEFPAEQFKAGDPALTALREQRSAARATARAHDHAFAPVISAQAQAGLQGVGVNLLPLYRVGVNVSVPLWDGGADSAARAAAQARAAELTAQTDEYAQAQQHARARAAAARAEALRRIGIAEELVRLNSARLAQLEEGFPLGAATLTQIADARAALQRAHTELVLAQAMRAEALLGVN